MKAAPKRAIPPYRVKSKSRSLKQPSDVRIGRGEADVLREVAPVYGAKPRSTNPFRLSTLDLFCGAGGLAEGFRLAGFSTIGGIDVDPDATATFALNFPKADVVCGDIRKPAIRERAIELARHADMVVGGPPCQAFSQVQNHSRLIEDPRNSLYRQFVHVVAETTPNAFVVENVTGMEQMGVREQIEEDLSLDGEYRVRSQIVDAADLWKLRRASFVSKRESASFLRPPPWKSYPPRTPGTRGKAHPHFRKVRAAPPRYTLTPLGSAPGNRGYGCARR